MDLVSHDGICGRGIAGDCGGGKENVTPPSSISSPVGGNVENWHGRKRPSSPWVSSSLVFFLIHLLCFKRWFFNRFYAHCRRRFSRPRLDRQIRTGDLVNLHVLLKSDKRYSYFLTLFENGRCRKQSIVGRRLRGKGEKMWVFLSHSKRAGLFLDLWSEITTAVILFYSEVPYIFNLRDLREGRRGRGQFWKPKPSF